MAPTGKLNARAGSVDSGRHKLPAAREEMRPERCGHQRDARTLIATASAPKRGHSMHRKTGTAPRGPWSAGQTHFDMETWFAKGRSLEGIVQARSTAGRLSLLASPWSS